MAVFDSDLDFELSLGLNLDCKYDSATTFQSSDLNVKKLCDIYGVHLDDEIKRCPVILPILCDLSKEIHPVSGLTIETDKNLKEAKKELEDAKQNFFEQQIVYRTFKDATKDGSFKANKTWKEIEKQMVKLEASQYFKPVQQNEDGILLLGLKPENILSKEIDSPSKSILSSLEKRIEDKFEKIIEYYGTTDKQSSADFLDLIETNKTHITQENYTLEILQQEYRNLIFIFYSDLKEAVETLNEMFRTDSINIHANCAQKNCKHLVEKLNLLLCKAEIIHQSILVKTYSPDNVKVLQTIKTDFLKEDKLLVDQTSEIKSQLNDYEKLGESFKVLVQEIKSLNSEIEIRKWGMEQLLQE